MSKNGMLDSIVPALMQVSFKYRGVVLNVIQRLADEDNAPYWGSLFSKALRTKPPKNKQYNFLKPIASAVMTAFNPQDLKACEDIWLSPEFVDRILSVAEDFQPTDDLSFPSGFDLIETANDSDIRSEFPKDHVFGPGEFCWRLKRMTQAQPKGALGVLLANGCANIFYVQGKGGEVFAVGVHWRGAHGQWRVLCYRLDEADRWYRDDRAFSRN